MKSTTKIRKDVEQDNMFNTRRCDWYIKGGEELIVPQNGTSIRGRPYHEVCINKQ